MIRKWRPANGTEGELFIEEWCDNCIHDRDAREIDPSEGCHILADTLCYDVNEPEYPEQWVTDEKGPRCTAFEPDEGQPTPRCKFTADMFGSTTTR